MVYCKRIFRCANYQDDSELPSEFPGKKFVFKLGCLEIVKRQTQISSGSLRVIDRMERKSVNFNHLTSNTSLYSLFRAAEKKLDTPAQRSQILLVEIKSHIDDSDSEPSAHDKFLN